MKEIIFRLLKSGKLASRRTIIAAVVVVSIFLLSFVAITGFAIWKVATHSVTQVQALVPKDIPEAVGSTIENVKSNQTIQGCMTMLSSLMSFEAWLTQPLSANVDKILMSCWPAQTKQQEEVRPL